MQQTNSTVIKRPNKWKTVTRKIYNIFIKKPLYTIAYILIGALIMVCMIVFVICIMILWPFIACYNIGSSLQKTDIKNAYYSQ